MMSHPDDVIDEATGASPWGPPTIDALSRSDLRQDLLGVASNGANTLHISVNCV